MNCFKFSTVRCTYFLSFIQFQIYPFYLTGYFFATKLFIGSLLQIQTVSIFFSQVFIKQFSWNHLVWYAFSNREKSVFFFRYKTLNLHRRNWSSICYFRLHPKTQSGFFKVFKIFTLSFSETHVWGIGCLPFISYKWHTCCYNTTSVTNHRFG